MSIIDYDFSVSMVTGRGGDGKTYSVVDELVHHRLVSWDYPLWTNLPLHVDKVAEYVAKQRGCEPEQIAQRIRKIPDETLAAWAQAKGGPWDLADNTHVDMVIDEIHVFCPKKGPRRQQLDKEGNPVIGPRGKPVTEDAYLAWERFLGEGRHHGVQRFQVITQALSKLHPVIDAHAAVRYGMEKTDRRRSKGFGVKLGDVYEALGSVTGKYQPLVTRVEEVKDAHGRWKHNDKISFVYHKQVFELYESHSAAGGKSSTDDSAGRIVREFERRPRLVPWMHDYRGNGKKELTAPTWLWAAWRNQRPFWMVGGAMAFLAFLFGGGIEWMMTSYSNHHRQRVTGEAPKEGTTNHVANASSGGVDAAVPGDYALAAGPGCGCGGDAKRVVRALVEHVEGRLDDDRQASSIVGVGPSFVAFASGSTYRVGETIADGLYAGSKLDAVDFRRRRIRINGKWLRYGPPLKDTTRSETEVRGLLQEAREIAQAAEEGDDRERSVLVSRRTEHEAAGSAQLHR